MKWAFLFLAGGVAGAACTPPVEQSFFFADIELPLVPSNVGLDFERFHATTSEGRAVAASWIPAEGASGTVVYSTGRSGNQSLDLTVTAATFTLIHSLDYNVVTYDYPGVGDSEGPTTFAGLGEALRSVVDHTRSRNAPGTDRIVLMGLSLGAMVTLSVAADAPESLVGVILVATPELGTFPTLASALRAALVGATDSLSAAGLDPVVNVGQLQVPLLMLHSVHDDVAPIAGGRRVFEAAPEPKTFIELQGNAFSTLLSLSPHVLYLQDNGPQYSEPIRAFLLDLAGD